MLVDLARFRDRARLQIAPLFDALAAIVLLQGITNVTRQQIRFVIFSLDEQQYALPLATVERVVRAVEITPLPNGPEIILGLINVQGRIMPVVNIRRRFGLPERELSLSDQLIIAHTSWRPLALVVDSVPGLTTVSASEMVAAEKLLRHTKYIEGALKLEGGLIFIHDLDTFLSLEEQQALAETLET
jgi:purine-binding chemotaxis protein CheW